MAVYALRVRKPDLGLLTLLGDGFVPSPEALKKEHYFIFEVSDDGREITTDVMTKRQMCQTYDLYARSPQLLHLKKLP